MSDAFAGISMALGAFYLLLIAALRLGLYRLRPGSRAAEMAVTVVVAARNESRCIDACLSALSAQDYPADRVEVVVVDDRSTDDTACRAQRWTGRIPGLRVIGVADRRYRCPKKNALDAGIRAGTGNLILTTDADCRPPPGWIASTVRCFAPDVGMVIGHAPLISEGGVLRGLLALQSLVVSALAAGSAGAGFPLSCSGRNLAYRRRAFHDAGGFAAIGHIPGGDDVLLMRQIASRTAWKIRFNPESGAGVPSDPHIDGLFHRQVRYQSKAMHYGVSALLLALPVYMFHLVLLACLPVACIHPEYRLPVALILAGKFALDGLFLWAAARRFDAWRAMRWFPILELVSIPYIVFVCALGALKPARWR